MMTFRVVGIKGDNQISQTFTIGELSEHQRKYLITISEMLYIFVAIMLVNDVVELGSI
jgi:hypothetical protein